MFAIITGASRGIGKALAYRFAKAGYDLILTCEKNIDMLSEVANDIKSIYHKKIFTKLGLISDDDIKKFEKSSSIDIKNNIYILINNAGKCDYNTIDKISDDRYKELMYANVDYAFKMTKNISKFLLKDKKGIIINITSMWGLLGASCEVVYSMTKGALIAFTKALAKEFRDSSVDAIAFALGAVDTDMFKELCDPVAAGAFLKTLDNGRLFTPDEISDMIYDYILYKKYKTGDIIELNNGLK